MKFETVDVSATQRASYTCRKPRFSMQEVWPTTTCNSRSNDPVHILAFTGICTRAHIPAQRHTDRPELKANQINWWNLEDRYKGPHIL